MHPHIEPLPKPHIADTPITLKTWHQHVNWLNCTFILGIPLYGFIQAFWVPLQLKTAIWAVAYYYITGLGITAGLFPLSPLVFLVKGSHNGI